MDKKMFLDGPLDDIIITFQNDPSQKFIVRSPEISDCHFDWEEAVAYGGRNNQSMIRLQNVKPLILELSAKSMELIIDKSDHSHQHSKVFAQPTEEEGLAASQNKFDSGYFLDENFDLDLDFDF